MGEVVRVKKISCWKGHSGVPPGLIGRYYPDTRTIYICNKFNKATQELFFLHELNHAIMSIVGIDQNMSNDLQEVIAQTFASFYYRSKI